MDSGMDSDMVSKTPLETRAAGEVYEKPSVVDLGTFAELTQKRSLKGQADNGNKLGTN